jgi:acrylyl-CoA reductase (NADPH)
MAIGTGGFTAMLCIIALEQHGVVPERGPVLVTGASGGVGSFSVSLLAKLGYRVIASTGRPQEADYLKALGATEIIDRAELSSPGKPLGKERWAGAIDSVGSHTLANACAGTMRGGSVAACGLAQGMDFPATVAPFILRGVNLLGVDTPGQLRPARSAAWQRLAALADESWFTTIAQDVPLSAVIATADELLAGKVRGRVVVDVNALRM